VTLPVEDERTASGRHRRADALRNRGKVLAAAETVLAERGLEAGVPEIAALAGVGKGTVYRSFPTREDLLAAVVVERLNGIVECAAAAEAEEPDAFAALRRVVVNVADRMAADRCLAESLSHVWGREDVGGAKAAVRGRLTDLLERAQRDGRVRDDVGYEDLAILLAGAGRVLGGHDPRAGAPSWRRYAALVLEALRPEGAHPLPD
jgi:AcrR family transcriptional regulator